MRVSVVQTKPRFGKVEENISSAVSRLRRLRSELVVLPELFSTGYQFRSKKEALSFAEPVKGGPATTALIEVAKEKRMYIVAGINERAGGKAYNSSVLVGPGGLIGVYRKAHLFWGEKSYFSRGNTPFKVYDIGKAKVGMMICFDWLFPEAARKLSLLGADIICHPSNLVLPYCPRSMPTRCLENGVFALTANRVGVEKRGGGKGLKFIGMSQIVGTKGEILARAAKSKAGTVSANIDPKKARNKRLTPTNDIFKDRRGDLY